MGFPVRSPLAEEAGFSDHGLGSHHDPQSATVRHPNEPFSQEEKKNRLHTLIFEGQMSSLTAEEHLLVWELEPFKPIFSDDTEATALVPQPKMEFS